MQNFVGYVRVSTDKQGVSGLGMAAQLDAIKNHVAKCGGNLVAIYEEVESGRRNRRPQLQEAIDCCTLTDATLVIAKLDRLSRNASFLFRLKDSGLPFVALDCPDLTTLNLGVLAIFAQHEAEVISKRTRDAMAAAKAQGRTFGCPTASANTMKSEVCAAGREAIAKRVKDRVLKLAPVMTKLKAQGVTTLQGFADALNEKGCRTARKATWTPTAVRRVLSQLPA